MKSPFQDSSSADISNRASTSSQPKNDRELGYITTSSNGNVARNNHFLKLPNQINTSLVRKVLAEALGTFILMFCIGGIVANMRFMGVEAGVLEYAATAGLTVTVIVFSIGSISDSTISNASFAARIVIRIVAGVAISLGVLISGPVSGGSMNPARSLGPALISWRFDHLWIYVVAPTIGAIAGVLAYRILRLQGWSCKPDPSHRTLQSSQSSLH
ncbi:UNVERIFIED_CONTAM: putative aquaporin NIP7-1 [Sesamum radiatum]|uniref:Aquaporin NIP7-1 n=1 Tax=Sesamum radiatum TaxID=300843 RepID=A0AAW2UFA5_SESRA